MKKHSYKITQHINKSINVKDKVKLIDGSGLSLNCKWDSPFAKNYYIVYDYPEITGLSTNLKNCIAEVIKTNITDIGLPGACNTFRIQDIIIKIGNAEFRTCSQFVIKI